MVPEMHCVVTAGPAYEPVDKVRRLTNFSTGRLGTELANFLAASGHEVTLLQADTAVFRQVDGAVRTRPFGTAGELAQALERCVEPSFPAVHAVFHAAAVSDFQAGKLWTWRESPGGAMEPVKAGKVSSDGRGLFLELLPAPKILGRLREWFPRAFLVGWKYEVDGQWQQAVGRGERQLREAGVDACVVNGQAVGEGFVWVTDGQAPRPLRTRAELFAVMLQSMERRQVA